MNPIREGESMEESVPYQIKIERCNRCGRCISACPLHCIRVVDDHLEIDLNRCNGCGKCVEECSLWAIKKVVPQ